MSRLSQLADDASGTTYDQTLGFAYNPASQIVSNTRSNDLFAWAGHGSGSTSSTANGLNQITAHGGTSTSHDSRGNMTADSLGKTFGYSSENLLTSASGSVTATYDPAMRLYQTVGAATTRFGYDGANLIAEYSGSNSLQRRFVFGSGVDEPLVWYEGSGTSDRRFLHADERGSIVAISNGSGTVTNVDTYDEYGKPGSGNVGRFQYTGQKWIAELGLYDYKARMYHPGLPRFLQTDTIGYGDGMNDYIYVGADPVNRTDPLGLKGKQNENAYGDIFVTARMESTSSDTVGGSGASAVLLDGDQSDPDVVSLSEDGWEIAINKSPGNKPFYFNGKKYISDSRYVQPWYAPYVDYGFVFGPPLVAAAAAAAPAAVAVEGPSVGYRLYRVGRLGQVRFFTNKVILRIDNKPIWHLNIEGRLGGTPYNFHLPPH